MYRCNFIHEGATLHYKEVEELPTVGNRVSFGTALEYTVESVSHDLNNGGNVSIRLSGPVVQQLNG